MIGLMSRSSASLTRLLTGRSRDLELAPALQRPDEGHLVGVLEVATDRDAARDPGDGADVARQPLGEVHRGRLALERRVGGEDHLLVRLAVAARARPTRLEQLADRAAGRGRCRPWARWRRGARGSGPGTRPSARCASTSSGSSTTHSAASSRDGSRQMGHSGPVLMLKHDSQNTTSSRTAMSAAARARASASGRAQQVVGQPLGGLGADAGQPRERLDEPGDRLDECGHGRQRPARSQAGDAQAAGHARHLLLGDLLGLVAARR